MAYDFDLQDALSKVSRRKDELDTKLAQPDIVRDAKAMSTLGREHRDISATLDALTDYAKLLRQIDEDRFLLQSENDPDILTMAKDELTALEAQEPALNERAYMRLVPRDPNDSRSTIVEIRAGTGGDEAGLFAADLLRMYQRYGERRRWKIEVLDLSEGTHGAIKEVVFSLEGDDVYGDMKFESGVHRVQRVPATEAQGRIHTSAASVVVLAEADEVDIVIKPEDLRVDTYCSSGPGGQSVNTTYSAVRITHIPTGTVVSCQDEKSQIKNRAKALKVLRSRLLDVAQREQQSKEDADRRAMVGRGDRSDKIRTYNYPQNRVTDHRIGLTVYKLDQVMEGDLDEFVVALKKAAALNQLAAATTEAED